MRAVVVGVVLAACGSSKSMPDVPSVARPRLADLDDSQITALVRSAYGDEVLSLRKLDNLARQGVRADSCPDISVSGNVVTIATPSPCVISNPPTHGDAMITVSGSATITTSQASTVYASAALEFDAFHVYQTFHGGLDGSLDVSTTGLWTGDIAYHPRDNAPPIRPEIRVQWTCDTEPTHCDLAGTEIVWGSSGSIAVTGSLQFSNALQQETGNIHLQGEDGLDAVWSSPTNTNVTWSIGARTGAVDVSGSSVGYNWTP